MPTMGIIAEYNPFHNGHKWHLEEARRISGCDLIVAVMSGNFMQRGEPALFDKWCRAEMAVRGGVNLVFELPVVFTVRSAQFFAQGAIRLLSGLGTIDCVCFGAETADLDILKALAKAFDHSQTVKFLKEELAAGHPYAKALGQALAKQTGIAADIAASPNNILAIEYLRAIIKFAPTLKPLVIPRQHAGYHDTDINGSIASATAIRNTLQNPSKQRLIETVVPPESADLINANVQKGLGPVFLDDLSQILLAKIRSAAINDLKTLPDISEGLHHRLKKSALQAGLLSELIDKIKTKRYSRTRLQRLLINLLLGLNEHQLREFDSSGPLYGRVLAFNSEGRIILRNSSNSSFPLITKTAQYLTSNQRSFPDLSPFQAMLSIDTLASDLYALAMPEPRQRYGGADFRTSPIYIPSTGQ